MRQGTWHSLSATPDSLLIMLQKADRLFGPENYRWSVIGVGYPREFHVAVTGIVMGGNIRVWLEDSIFVRRRVLATNVELIEKVKRLAAELEREIAAPGEAREILGLKGIDAINI